MKTSVVDMNENIFRRLMPKLKKDKKKPPPSAHLAPDLEGGIFRLWNWALPLLLGLAAGWFGMTCLEVWLDVANTSNRPVAASHFATSGPETDSDNMAAFLRTNPFKVTPMTIPEPMEELTDAPPPIVGSLATAILKGTSPGYIAWMEDQGKLRLIMLGDSFDVYTLEEVTYLDATFVKDEERVVKEIFYGRESPAASLPEPRLSSVGVASTRQVVSPDPNSGAGGIIDRDTINQLLENPFEELRKVRLRPAENGQGLQIQWINRDSILAQLGVQKDDVIHSINGIAFQNAMDITNSLSSLMNSDQFIVEVMRNGAATSLQYEVR